MKTNEFKNMIDTILTEQVKNIILEQVSEGKKQVYHIKCNGEPIDTFNSKEEAESHLDIYKKNHPGKQFIIEMDEYDSDGDMIDKLDELGQDLEEKENENMEKNPVKVKSLAEAILHAKENNKKKIKVNNIVHDVEESWKQLQEEEGECMECGDMNEDSNGKECPHCHGEGKHNDGTKCEKCHGTGKIKDEHKMEFKRGVDLGKSFEKMKSKLEEDDECDECSEKMEMPEGFDEYVKKMGSDMKTIEKYRIVKKPETMKESKNKKLRLKESEFIELINKMVTEAMKGEPGIPGIPGVTITKKSQSGSKKDNDQHLSDVGKKIKDYLSFDGNDNPEFPHQIGGDKMAVNNTEDEDETVDDNRGRMMVDINYDNEPSKTFKQRAKDALEGSTKLGNPKDAANAIPSKLGNKIEKQGEKLQKIKKQEPRYPKETLPIKTVKENRISLSDLLD